MITWDRQRHSYLCITVYRTITLYLRIHFWIDTVLKINEGRILETKIPIDYEEEVAMVRRGSHTISCYPHLFMFLWNGSFWMFCLDEGGNWFYRFQRRMQHELRSRSDILKSQFSVSVTSKHPKTAFLVPSHPMG